MPIKDQIKNLAKKFVEDHPDAATLRALVRARKPTAIRFQDDGIVPNNPHFPVLLYRGAVNLKTRLLLQRSSSTRCSIVTAGAALGAIRFMTLSTIIRRSTK